MAFPVRVWHYLCRPGAEQFPAPRSAVIVVIYRVVSRFLSRRFHPKNRRLFPFYLSNITLRTDLLTFGVTGAVFKIAGEMRQLPAYFDNPEYLRVPSHVVGVLLCLVFRVS